EAPKPAAPAAKPARSERPERHARRGHDEADHGESGHKHGRHERPKKSNAMPLIASAVGLVAIGIVVAFVMMKGGDAPKADPKTDTTAKVETPAPKVETPAAPKVEAAATPAPTPANATPAPAATPPAAAPADASAPATPDDPTRVKKPWEKQKNPPTSLDQVSDPKTFGEVKWPDGVDAAKKAELIALAADVVSGGRPGIVAKPKLIKEGFLAMFGIVERLRLLDYKSPDDSMIAFELNKMIEEISAGMNARFEPCEASEEIPPAKAQWNALTVKAWINILGGLDQAKYEKDRVERVKKANK
ncbi:MAG: hypothetical protein WBO45_05305, partial [Planctomycetota bacterium]